MSVCCCLWPGRVRRVVVEVAAVTPRVTTSWPRTIHWARLATLQNKKVEVWCARVYGLHPPPPKKTRKNSH